MALGRDLNQTENFAAAEDAYRAALAVQERVLGRDNPNTATAMLHLAVNLSNQKRLAEARRAARPRRRPSPRARPIPATPARAAALSRPACAERRRPGGGDRPAAAGRGRLWRADPGLQRGARCRGDQTSSPTRWCSRRCSAWPRPSATGPSPWCAAGRAAEASAVIDESRQVLRRAGLEPNMMVGRAMRTEAGADIRLGRTEAAAQLLERAAGRFGIAAPGERPEAVTLFLAGQQRIRAGRRAEALAAFRAGAAILRARQIGLSVRLVVAYLDALDQEANASPGLAPGAAGRDVRRRPAGAAILHGALCAAGLGAAGRLGGQSGGAGRGARAAGCRPRIARVVRRARRRRHAERRARRPHRRRPAAPRGGRGRGCRRRAGLSAVAARLGRCGQRRPRARARRGAADHAARPARGLRDGGARRARRCPPHPAGRGGDRRAGRRACGAVSRTGRERPAALRHRRGA